MSRSSTCPSWFTARRGLFSTELVEKHEERKYGSEVRLVELRNEIQYQNTKFLVGSVTFTRLVS